MNREIETAVGGCSKNDLDHDTLGLRWTLFRFLVLIDAHSKWLEVYPMSSMTSTATIQQL